MLTKCPTCKARYKGKPVCRRCGTDLGKLADILDRAVTHLEMARAAHAAENYPEMLRHARRAASLRGDAEALKLLACAAMLNRQFDEALRIWILLGSGKTDETG